MFIFSPHPHDRSEKLRPSETEAERDIRVAKFHADDERFRALMKQMKDEAITKPAVMDGGLVYDFSDADGNKVMIKRPCDSYAIQL